MSALLRDFRYAARQLGRTPGFTAIAILTLALGIGASTAVFSLVNALVFRPAGARLLDDVYAVSWRYRYVARPRTTPAERPALPRATVSDFRAFQRQPPEPIAAVTATQMSGGTVRMPGKADRIAITAIAGDYARVFGFPIELGRLVDRDDEIAALANVVISHRLWRDWFGSSAGVLGQTLTINNTRFVIVGVASRAHVDTDAWVPMSAWRAMRPDSSIGDAFYGTAFIRLRSGAPAAAAEPAFRALYGGSLEVTSPTGSWMGLARPAREMLGVDRMVPVGLTLLTLSLMVLLAACANLANLLYVRGARRAGEVAVRLSLGGGQRDILRLFLAEIAILTSVSVALGLALSSAALYLTGLASARPGASSVRFSPRELGHLDLTMDVTTYLYAIGAGVVAALVAGLMSAWRASRVPPLQTLAAAGVPAGVTPRGRRWRTALVAVQVTAAVLLMMSTAIWVQRLADDLDTTVKFDTSGITAARIDLSLHEYTATRGRAFYQDALDRARAIPGVTAAALADGLPGHAYVSRGLFTLTAEPKGTRTLFTSRRISGAYAGVSDGFLEALGVRLLRGRSIRPSDTYDTAPVAVICESAAARLWPGEEALGQRMMFGNDRRWREVVGISSDPIESSKDTQFACASCVAFVPWAQEYRAQMLIMVRSDRPAAMVEPLQAAIRAVDADVAIQETAPLDETLLAWSRQTRAAALLMASLGALALLIASLGVYGVVSFLVSARTREFGIRMALGATPRGVIRLVLDHALHLMLVGLLPAVLIASLGTRLLQSQIRDLMPNDIPTWIAVPVLVLLVGLLAGYIPARRASKIDPTVALREL